MPSSPHWAPRTTTAGIVLLEDCVFRVWCVRSRHFSWTSFRALRIFKYLVRVGAPHVPSIGTSHPSSDRGRRAWRANFVLAPATYGRPLGRLNHTSVTQAGPPNLAEADIHTSLVQCWRFLLAFSSKRLSPVIFALHRDHSDLCSCITASNASAALKSHAEGHRATTKLDVPNTPHVPKRVGRIRASVKHPVPVIPLQILDVLSGLSGYRSWPIITSFLGYWDFKRNHQSCSPVTMGLARYLIPS